MHTLHTTAGQLAYEDTGTGPAIVLLHANLHDHHDFDPIVPALAAEHRVITLDWPGHGASEPNPTATAVGFADTLVEFVTALELDRAVFLGNSVGGYAAARLAIDHPDHVAGLVLVNTGGFVHQSPLTRAYCNLYGSAAVARYLIPRSVRAYMKAVSPADDAAIDRAIRFAATAAGRATYRSLWHSFNDPAYDLTTRAASITAPTLIVWGGRDPVLPPRYGKLAHRLIPNSQLHVLPTGHLPFSSTPTEFLDLLLPFLTTALTPTTGDGPAAR
ncbi:alpha/beta fold hydrolase [Nocardia sp. NPDC059240]|uniref:alpha/beta fold hydrolase n=1 Tax=Nocardia sp. NPDC059240 TaxID=3346786 RepID=UPI00367A14CC